MSYNSTSCSSGVRAAEIIAAALGKAGRSFPEDLLLSAKNLHLANPEPAKKLARRAIETVLKIGAPKAVRRKQRVRSLGHLLVHHADALKERM